MIKPSDPPDGALAAPAVPQAAVVTGAGQRIGRACALALRELGYAVAVHYHRSREAADGVATAIRDGGGNAITLAADLADEDAVKALLPRASAALGPIGILVNNMKQGTAFDEEQVPAWPGKKLAPVRYLAWVLIRSR